MDLGHYWMFVFCVSPHTDNSVINIDMIDATDWNNNQWVIQYTYISTASLFVH